MLLNVPGLIFFVTICVLSGMVLFAYYVGTLQCDVYAAGFIDSSNQVNVNDFFCLSVDRWKRTDLASFHRSQRIPLAGSYGLLW